MMAHKRVAYLMVSGIRRHKLQGHSRCLANFYNSLKTSLKERQGSARETPQQVIHSKTK
jgi:hypothetical protein